MIDFSQLKRYLTRRQLNIWLGLCSLVVALSFAACTPGAPPTETSPSPSTTNTSGAPELIRIGYQLIPNAELLVKATGAAEKAFPNTKIEWKKFDSGRDVNTAMAANSLDLGLVGSTGAAIGISNGLPYQVYFIHNIIGDNEALAVRTELNIQSLADLKGKRVAVPFGSTTHFSLLSALEQEGISSSDVTVLDMQPPDILAAWQRGDIDASFVWQPTLAKLVDEGGTILTTAKVLSQQGIVTADVGVAHTDFISQYPDVLAQYVALLDDAIRSYREEPEDAAEAIAPELGLTPEESLTVMNELVWLDSSDQASEKYLGTPDAPGSFAKVLNGSADFMKAQGSIETLPEPAAFQKAIYSNALEQ